MKEFESYKDREEFFKDFIIDKGIQDLPKKSLEAIREHLEREYGEVGYKTLYEKGSELIFVLWGIILGLKDRPQVINKLKPKYGWNLYESERKRRREI